MKEFIDELARAMHDLGRGPSTGWVPWDGLSNATQELARGRARAVIKQVGYALIDKAVSS